MTEDGKPGSSLKEWAKSIGFPVVACLILRTFVVQAFHITSESMDSALLTGDVLWVATWCWGVCWYLVVR